MTVTCYGAAREVTGSCYLLATDRARILIDNGLFQGNAFCEERNREPLPFDPRTIDAVIVTHAHLDHTGRLPLLVKQGFRGPLFMTPPTRDLTRLVLHDAAGIMQEDFERHGLQKLYAEEDVERALERVQPIGIGEERVIGDLHFRLREAGHIFGSAFVEISERGGANVVFSGDLGNEHVPFLRPSAPLGQADVVFIESTYGNRIHEDESVRAEKLQALISQTIRSRGVLLIPAFAIERTQQLLYELYQLIEHKRISPLDVYLDSPMAIKASKIMEDYPDYYNQETFREYLRGEAWFDFPELHTCLTRDASKAINMAPMPKLIIAGSGMMNGGRILHHLVRYLGSPENTVLIVGYQAQGTLGHELYEGKKHVEVLGERIEVKAQIASIGAYSAHADMHKLLGWIGAPVPHPKRAFCTHGEEGACVALATGIQERFGISAQAPKLGQAISI